MALKWKIMKRWYILPVLNFSTVREINLSENYD
jgi:hypothetical protein